MAGYAVRLTSCSMRCAFPRKGTVGLRRVEVKAKSEEGEDVRLGDRSSHGVG